MKWSILAAWALLTCTATAQAADSLFSPIQSRSVSVAGDLDLKGKLAAMLVGKPIAIRMNRDLTTDLHEVRLVLAHGLVIDAIKDRAHTVCRWDAPETLTIEKLKAPDAKCHPMTVWEGHAKGKDVGPDNSIIIVAEGRQMDGAIAIGKRVFLIKPLKGGDGALYEMDSAREQALGGNDAVVPPPAEVEKARKSQVETSPANAKEAISITVMVGFTQGAWNSQANPQMAAQRWIAEANSGLSYSGINVQYQLVSAFNTGAPEAANTQDDLNNIRTGAGKYSEVETLRKGVRADLVALVVGARADGCGRGYMPASYAYAYTVSVDSCAETNLTLAHELGHNLSANHDPANASNSYRPYSHGYQLTGWSRTVMAYPQPCGCTRYNVWSSPNVRFSNGQPAGNASQSDNVRSMNEYAPVVAAFFP